MAEFLIRAKGHWKDEWNQTKVDGLTPRERDSYNARLQLGDIIVIMPDGWKWGKAECLPDFVLVKIPDMTVEEARQYVVSITEQYYDEHNNLLERTLRCKKWFLKPTWVSTIISQGGVFTISKDQVVNYIEQKVL